MKILAIESSCDETAAAVVEDGRRVLSNVIASQVEEHKIYGGVVPEIASRRHAEAVCAVTEKALADASCSLHEDIDAIAVTYAPGLIGALLVGVNFAKGLALSADLPLIPVHHLRGHIAGNYLTSLQLEPPFLALVVSGGHSHIIDVQDYTRFKIIGRTRDDAAGETLDKAARALGIPYPGGLNMDKLCAGGDVNAYKFPRPRVDGCPDDFSFSGLKTSVVNLVHNLGQKGEEIDVQGIGASFMDAVTGLLCEKTFAAAEKCGSKKLVLAGGVSANSMLRAKMEKECKRRGIELFMPAREFCGDNAAMIGSQGYYEYKSGVRAEANLNAYATMPIDESRI